ncbi:MAG: ABC transporter permease [Saccharofermentans sp.]|nr:ABC transporter permease [Saccharofermentans sp.]
MGNLLKNDLCRLVKNKLYWGVVIVFAFMTFYTSFQARKQCDSVDDLLGAMLFYLEIAVSAFVPLFVVSEYKSGVVKNKIIAGFSRLQIYVSLLITSVVSALGILVAWVIAYYPYALALYGTKFGYDHITNADRWEVILAKACLVVVCATFAVLVSTVISRKSVTIVILVVGTLFYYTFFLPNILMTRKDLVLEDVSVEQMDESTYAVTYTATEDEEEVDNSHKRKVLETVDNVMFCGHEMLIDYYNMEKVHEYILWDSVAAVVYAGFGLVVFKLKDFK